MKNENLSNVNLCEKTELLIDEYLEGMISLQDKEVMDDHISACKYCADYFTKTSALVKQINSLPADVSNLNEQQKDDIWKKVEMNLNSGESSKTDNQKPGFISKYKYFLAGIAALLAIGFLVFALKNVNLKDVQLAQSNFGLPTYWKVSNVKGNPMIGDIAMQSVDSIKEGQWIRTNDSSSAELIVANIGTITIEPNSKIIFVKGAEGDRRILVEYGTIEADMKSKPNTFFVEMPSATASDQGGEYTLTIDSSGDGLVYVKSGKVDVQSQNRGAVVPAGSLVMTKKDQGVGTPFNENSSPKFKNALFNFDFGDCSGSCVSTLLNNAKISDAVTLVNLIPNVENQYKEEVYAKLANFVPPPPNVPGVYSDSIEFFNEDEVNEWIDKIQVEVQQNVERSMKDVEKNLEQMKVMAQFNFDTLKALQNFAKDWKFQMKTAPGGTYYWSEDTAGFDEEEFKKDMDEMQKDLNETYKFDQEQYKEDMEGLKEDLKELQIDLLEDLDMNNEEIKKELEKAKEEIKNAIKEVEKVKVVAPPSFDTTGNKYRVKVKVNSEEPEEIEIPEPPDPDNK